jgi:hypothetical protein
MIGHGRFTRFVAIDWSGQAVARPKGLALAIAGPGIDAPALLTRDRGWSRADILDWIADLAARKVPALIGIDLSPALPFVDAGAYFPGWSDTPGNAVSLWQLVDQLCAEDEHMASNGVVGHPEAKRHFRLHGECGDLFPGGLGRLRVCEHAQREMGLSPTSCFNLVGAAQVGKSSLTGMRVLHSLRGRVPVWPFDPVPEDGPLIVEIYTTIAARAAGVRKGRSKIRDAASLDVALDGLGTRPHAPLARYDDHATDAILTAAWLRNAYLDPGLWHPSGLTPKIARTEGWTFGCI